MTKSHLTAIVRDKLSLPMQYLTENGKLDKYTKSLDYGCGKAFDALFLRMCKYDKYFYPSIPDDKFDVITCNYVLNVIDNAKETVEALDTIRGLLAENGVAFISVRRDKANYGEYTKRGTFQKLVYLNLPIEKENSNFCMYRLEK